MSTHVPSLKLSNGLSIPQLGLGVWQASDTEAEFAVSEAHLKRGQKFASLRQ